jgi:hypothetical protein
MSKVLSEVTCEVCGRLYKSNRRRHHCDHCNVYYFVCGDCQARRCKCPHCGIPLKKRAEPLAKNRTNR